MLQPPKQHPKTYLDVKIGQGSRTFSNNHPIQMLREDLFSFFSPCVCIKKGLISKIDLLVKDFCL
jgi:hypothetical protein